jgi:hypothetical protein
MRWATPLLPSSRPSRSRAEVDRRPAPSASSFVTRPIASSSSLSTVLKGIDLKLGGRSDDLLLTRGIRSALPSGPALGGPLTSEGSPHGRFTRAIKQRNLFQAEIAAREMRGLSCRRAGARHPDGRCRTGSPCFPTTYTRRSSAWSRNTRTTWSWRSSGSPAGL